MAEGASYRRERGYIRDILEQGDILEQAQGGHLECGLFPDQSPSLKLPPPLPPSLPLLLPPTRDPTRDPPPSRFVPNSLIVSIISSVDTTFVGIIRGLIGEGILIGRSDRMCW